MEASLKEKKNQDIEYIELIIVFVILVTVGMFAMMRSSKNATRTDIECLINMQSVTLAVSAISISLFTGIVSVFMFFKEKKTKSLNIEVEKNLLEITKEREILSKLLYLQANHSYYLSEIQYKSLISIGDEICNSNILYKYQLLYIVASLLQEKANNPKNTDIKIREIYRQIIRFTKQIITDSSVKSDTKTEAIFMFVDAHYSIFRNEFDKNPDTTNIQNLEVAIFYLNEYNYLSIEPDNNVSSTELNLIGLIYYWMYKYSIKNSTISDNKRKELLFNSENFFKQAITKKSDKEQIHNNYGCCLLEIGKYYASKNASMLCDEYYNKAYIEFKNAIKIFDSYEKPYINLIDICCFRIKSILGLTQNVYLLHPLIAKNDISNEEIKKYIKEGESYYNSALKSGKILYNVYYKMAELEIYRLLISYREKDGQNKNIENRIIKLLNKSEADKKSIKLLYKKRDFYELCDKREDAKNVNFQIQTVDSENAECWKKLYDDNC